MRFFHWYNECVEAHQADPNLGQCGQGKDSRSRAVDYNLSNFDPDWCKASGIEKKPRRQKFHIEKTIGRKWCHLVNYLGCGVSLLCGSKID